MIAGRIRKIAGWLAVIIALTLSFAIGLFVRNENTSATLVSDYGEYTDEYIKKRALYRGLEYCYNDSGKLKEEIDYNGLDTSLYWSVITSDKTAIFKSGGSFKVPAGYFAENSLECYDKASSKNLMSQIASVSSENISNIRTNDMDARTKYYQGMGYQASSSTGNATTESTTCYHFTYTYASGAGSGETNKLCLDSNSDGRITNIYSEGSSSGGSVAGEVLDIHFNAWYDGSFISDGNSYYSGAFVCGANYLDLFIVVNYDLVNEKVGTNCAFAIESTSVQDIGAWLEALITEPINEGYNFYITSGIPTTIVMSSPIATTKQAESSSSFGNYDLYTQAFGIHSAIMYLEKIPTMSNIDTNISRTDAWSADFNDTELYYIYMGYLKKYYSPTIGYTSCGDSDGGESYLPIVFKNENGSKKLSWCPIDNYNYLDMQNAKSTEKITTGSTLSDNSKLLFTDLVYKIRNLGTLELEHLPAYNEYFEEAVPDEAPGSSGGTINPGDDEKNCYDAGIEGMSWILCPAMNNMEYTASSLDKMIEGWLSVDSGLYNAGSPAYTAWDIMRGVANTLMIIFLIAIIFSQLTGYGIDNYGVKKMLPRLIAMAILLNLSFIICELAVDLSNVLGVGLRNMFGAVGDAVLQDGGYAEMPPNFIAGVVASILAIAGIAGTAAPIIVTAVSVGSGPMVIIIIVLALLVVLASVLIFFMMLGARMIIIVLCIALAPIAFACFILPNTQNLFKKWWDIFKTALIMYPICGALGGISYLVKAIAVTADEADLWLAVVALIAPYLVFFLLPTLLKGAIAALGRVGGALAAMGTAFKGGVSRGSDSIQNTEAFKSRMQSAKDFTETRRAAERAGRVKARLDSRRGSGRSLSARQLDQLSKANATLQDWDKRQRETQVRASADSHNAALARQELEIDQAAQDALLYNDAGVVATEATQRANARMDRLAQGTVGVLPVNQSLAVSRAQSRRDAQEFKAYSDQFAGYDRAGLRAEARSASTWLHQAGGQQRMSALLGAMKANGMESDMFDTLRSNDVSNMSGVMQTLAGMDNKVLRAYGKKGSGIKYDAFMTGTGAGSMQGYVDEKGRDFNNGLDDKALAEIARYGDGTYGSVDIMNNNLLVDAAARMSGADSLQEVNNMLSQRLGRGDTISMTGEQLANMDDSTVIRMLAEQSGRDALLNASDDMARNTDLVTKFNADSKTRVNTLRSMNGKGNL